MDTDAIRRAWPDVLGRVFQMSRTTWTFVSQNAQVIGYDGRVLTFGIATEGLTNRFRSGNHAEIVRQALIEQLGVDAVVEGVHRSEASGPPQGPAAPPQGQPTPPREAAADPAPPTARHRTDGGTRGGGAIADAGLAPTPANRSLEDNAGWGSASAPPPDWASGPTSAPATPQGNGTRGTVVRNPPVGEAPGAEAPRAEALRAEALRAEALRAEAPRPGDQPRSAGQGPAASQRSGSGAHAVRASLDAARRAGTSTSIGSHQTASVAPTGASAVSVDDAVSADDEDIELSTDTGRAVIEKVLGGRVLQEFDE